MRWVVPSVLAALLVAGGCSGSSKKSSDGVVCLAVSNACTCSVEPPQPGAAQASTCDTSYLPQTTCCAAAGWPSSGNCECVTSAIYCGVVPGYFLAIDGGPGEDGCVCSVGPSPQPNGSQSVGATCYPNGTTTSGPGLGTCCFYPADAPGSLGVPLCACATGLHSCAQGAMQVARCSADSFPALDPSCHGDTQVASCN